MTTPMARQTPVHPALPHVPAPSTPPYPTPSLPLTTAAPHPLEALQAPAGVPPHSAGVSYSPITVNFFTNHGPVYGGDHHVFAATAPPTTTPVNAVTEAPPRSRLRRVAVVCLLLALVAIVCAALAAAHPRTVLIWQVGSQVFTAAGGLAGLVGVALTIGSLDRRREGRR